MKKSIHDALAHEKEAFEEHYHWIEEHMPPSFFDEFSDDQIMTVVHNLMGFQVQGEFAQIHFNDCSIVICLDGPGADLKVLKHYAYFGIQNYQTFVSDTALPGKTKNKIRIAVIYYTSIVDGNTKGETSLNGSDLEEIFDNIKTRNSDFTKKEFHSLIESIGSRYLRILTKERMEMTLEMYHRAKTRDHLQYEVRLNEDWVKSHKKGPSMQIVFAWKNTHKYKFLFKLAKLVDRHNLIMKNVNSAYIDPYSSENILLMSLSLHGTGNTSAWKATNLEDFLRELATLKYFDDGDLVESNFVSAGHLCGNEGNLLRSIIDLSHQFLLHADVNMYSKDNIIEALVRHTDITTFIIKAFATKFHPQNYNIEKYKKEKASFLKQVEKIDTGNLSHDVRRKNVLNTAFSVVDYTLKTNYYRKNKSSLAFRIDPNILTSLFYDYTVKFPELPYGIFFIKGKSFIGFQVRFKDLARGGLRTIFPKKPEHANWERINIFSECYNLAYTQQKKNKDIPEGGSKAVIFVEPFEDLSFETEVYQKELHLSEIPEKEIAEKISTYHKGQRNVYLYSSQRSFIFSLMTLINCKEDETLKARDILDYHGRPEYIYLGPDENMHNTMIEWIADYSVRVGYKLGAAFISSKPKYGINHKEYGVTSYGVNVYMHNILLYLNINPEKDPFTVKISGGPDGDVAGNQIYNLYKYYRETAKVLAITDVSGTIYDPEGLDLEELVKLFKEEKPLRFYPAKKLHSGGLLLDIETRKEKSASQTLTLCYRKNGSKLEEDWLLGNETHHLYSNNLHQVKSDIFIPGGGRPRTLNIKNYKNFLDKQGVPTSRAIVEGANLYLTEEARAALEKLNVLIIKDSSANKGGVMCSSLEVLCSLLMENDEFLENKTELMKDVLNFIREKSQNEATLLLESHSKYDLPLTEISDRISKKINNYTYEILDYLEHIELPDSLSDPLIQTLVDYLLPLFQKKFKKRILKNIPDMHKKAIIACALAQKMVYTKGLSWKPSIVDILPLIIKESSS
jgi:glutamate dehydrogenase